MASKSNSFTSDDYDKLDMDSDQPLLDSPAAESYESGSFNWEKITGQSNLSKFEDSLNDQSGMVITESISLMLHSQWLLWKLTMLCIKGFER